MALTTEERRDLRAEVGNKCERCGAPEYFHRSGNSSLVIHHKIERHLPDGTDERGNLEVLCPGCHGREHYQRNPELYRLSWRKRRMFAKDTDKYWLKAGYEE